jgi:hypothetical protein
VGDGEFFGISPHKDAGESIRELNHSNAREVPSNIKNLVLK